MSSDLDDVREFWNRVADDWQIQVGSDGDANRRLNSDPVLWQFVGDVRGLRVLDAGCGTGYLSSTLATRGARVTGIDFAERMIAIARRTDPTTDFRVDSCSELATVGDAEVDVVVANYVLMDTPDLQGTMKAFHRVLKPGGVAVLVFSHPCFPAGRATVSPAHDGVTYEWDSPYFRPRKHVDPPWAHFRSEFTWSHRPLSDYWKTFIGTDERSAAILTGAQGRRQRPRATRSQAAVRHPNPKKIGTSDSARPTADTRVNSGVAFVPVMPISTLMRPTVLPLIAANTVASDRGRISARRCSLGQMA
jgi:ubiquinone/menaquinone biosynthesis C-methylase UbiE